MAVDLPGAFQNIHNLFNTWNYTGMGAVMDQNIIAKRLLHPDSVSGKNNVTPYLNSQMLPDRPTLTYLSNIVYYPLTPADQANATYGHVSGDGLYCDSTVKGDTPFPVHFTWCFTRSGTTQDWLLVNVFGYRTG
jgi:hypothetical protein